MPGESEYREQALFGQRQSIKRECEMDPDHLYHDHREAEALRVEIERLHDALELALGELSRTDLSDRDARRGAWTLIGAALTDGSPVVEGPSDGFMNDDGSYGDGR